MTKRKGYIPTMTMMLFLAFGSTIANAGIVITGRAAATETTATCTETKTETLVSYLSKIATFAKTGIVITGRTDAQCAERTGIVITG